MIDRALGTNDAETGWLGLWKSGYLFRFLLFGLGVWLYAADALLAATLIPKAVEEIGGLELISWTVGVFMVASVVAGVSAGFFVQARSIKSVMLVAIGLYVTGCAISALAPGMSILLLGRVFQGLGGGALLSLTLVAVERLFPKQYWTQMVALVSVIWGASSFLGPLIGGIFAEADMWRSGFWFFGVQAVMLGIAIAIYIDGDNAFADDVKKLPVKRLLLLVASMLLIAAAGIEISLVQSPSYLLSGFAGLVLFLRMDARYADNRLLPSNPFSFSCQSGKGLIAILSLSVATASFAVYGPILMIRLHGASPIIAGYIIAVESIAWSLGAMVFARVSAQRTSLLIKSGSIIIMASLVWFAIFMPVGPLLAILPGAVAVGIGFGMIWVHLARLTIDGAPTGETNQTSAALPSVQIAGYAIGAALSGMVANWAGFSKGAAMLDYEASQAAFWVFSAFIPFAIAGIIAVWRISPE